MDSSLGTPKEVIFDNRFERVDMKKIYIGSFYQSNTYKHPLTGEEKATLNRILDEDGTLVVSQETLDLSWSIMEDLDRLKRTTPFSDYVTALYCDIEVAIQEQKLINMAEKLDFKSKTMSLSCFKPKMRYQLEMECLLKDLTLTKEDTHEDTVYVINTHGSEQTLDGPYHDSMRFELGHQRIVIDACSSASGAFPIKRSGNKSAIHMLADEIIGVIERDGSLMDSQLNTLEIVGYQNKFTTAATNLTAVAVFARKE